MKTKLLSILLLSVLATAASAVTFKWSAAGVSFGGEKVGQTSAITGYLVYLGGSDAGYATSYTISETTTGESLAKAIDVTGAIMDGGSATGTSKMSKLQGQTDFEWTKYENGDVFGMLLVYQTADKTYFNLSSATSAISGLTDEITDPAAATFSFSFATADPSSSVKSGGGWTAVPEPSTAALALAGLALLIKRRRA